MQFVISSLEGAIRDGITLLTQRRINRNAPPYLVPPKEPLVCTVREMTPTMNFIMQAAVEVSCCSSWGGTKVTLNLSSFHDYWQLWGLCTILYGPGYPLFTLVGKRIDRRIMPSHRTNRGEDRPMTYHISSVFA